MLPHLTGNTPSTLLSQELSGSLIHLTSYDSLSKIFIQGRWECSRAALPATPSHSISHTWNFSTLALIACIMLLASKEMFPTSKFFSRSLVFLLEMLFKACKYQLCLCHRGLCFEPFSVKMIYYNNQVYQEPGTTQITLEKDCEDPMEPSPEEWPWGLALRFLPPTSSISLSFSEKSSPTPSLFQELHQSHSKPHPAHHQENKAMIKMTWPREQKPCQTGPSRTKNSTKKIQRKRPKWRDFSKHCGEKWWGTQSPTTVGRHYQPDGGNKVNKVTGAQSRARVIEESPQMGLERIQKLLEMWPKIRKVWR